MYGEAWETELPASKFDDRLLKELFWLALVLMKILLPGVLWLLGISLLFLSKCSVYVGKSSRSQQNKSGKLIQIAKEREAPMCCFLESFWHWTGDSSIWDFLCVTHMKPKGTGHRTPTRGLGDLSQSSVLLKVLPPFSCLAGGYDALSPGRVW